MNLNKILRYALIAGMQFWTFAEVVESVEFSGLSLVPEDKAEEMIVIPFGTEITHADIKKQIKLYYETGLYQQVIITQEGTTLHIHLVEQPVVNKIKVDSTAITSDEIKKQLEKIGIIRGEVLNERLLEQFIAGSRIELRENGYPDATIELEIVEETETNANIYITIEENAAVKISQVNFEGDKHYSTRMLRGNTSVREAGLLSFMMHDNRFSPAMISGDKDRLQDFYKSQGYLQPSISLDIQGVKPKQRVWGSTYKNIVYDISSGPKFKVAEVEFQNESEWDEALKQTVQKVTNQQVYTTSLKQKIRSEIKKHYGKSAVKDGEFYDVRLSHETVGVGEIKLNATLVTDVRYARYINFVGNKNTMDSTLRQAIKLQEAAPFDEEMILASKFALQNLGFLKRVKVSMVSVGENQYDIIVDVAEASTFQADLKADYSGGFSASISASDKNILGTGNAFSTSIQASLGKVQTSASFAVPRLNLEGHSLALSALYSKQFTSNSDDKPNYRKDVSQIGLDYGIPFDDFARGNLGLSLSRDEYFDVDSADSRAREFFDEFGTNIKKITFSGGVGYVMVDSTYMPTTGIKAFAGSSIAVNTSFSDPLYTHYASLTGYYPVSELYEQPIVLRARVMGKIAEQYRDGEKGEVPFNSRFYAGGLGTARGYSSGSLGPTFENKIRSTKIGEDDGKIVYGDVARVEDKAKGGNKLLFGTLELQLPSPNPDLAIPYLFVDYGNVFDDGTPITFGGMKGSAGLSAKLVLPMATFTVSLARPINNPGDKDFSTFSFATGVMF